MLLPAINAVLNTISACLLVVGFVFIKRKNIEAHRKCMLAAFGVSSVFLVSYLVHHYQVGSVPFRGTGALRTLYFVILIPHVILAAALVPLALLTIRHGLRRDVPRHRSLARVTHPIWLFVSVSGVVVYLMLYQR